MPNETHITKRTTAAQALDAIRTNVDAWYADQITYDEFGARAFALWDAVHARGERFADRVLALWRQGTYGAA